MYQDMLVVEVMNLMIAFFGIGADRIGRAVDRSNIVNAIREAGYRKTPAKVVNAIREAGDRKHLL